MIPKTKAMEIMTCQNHQHLSSKDMAKWLIILKSKWHLECEGSGVFKIFTSWVH